MEIMIVLGIILVAIIAFLALNRKDKSVNIVEPIVEVELDVPNLSEMTKGELVTLATQRQVRISSKDTKPVIIAKILRSYRIDVETEQKM
jgi:hypothetical protein